MGRYGLTFPLCGVLAALALSSCTAIDLGQLAPDIAPMPTKGCVATYQLQSEDYASLKTNAATVENDIVASLFQGDSDARAVVHALIEKTTASAALGKVRAQTSGGAKSNLEIPLRSELGAGSLSHSTVKGFAEQLAQVLRPGTLSNPNAPDSLKTLRFYAEQYYQGKYVDRLGTPFDKPTVSKTITDVEIENVLLVFIDFVIDSVDETPAVWGDTPKYVAGSTNLKFPTPTPTAFAAHGSGSTRYSGYEQEDNTALGCGITKKKWEVMRILAKVANSSGALFNGLVSQSAGGLGVSLGIFGKISIGDNQMLASVIKTTAGRLAERATLASAYNVVHLHPAP